MPLQSLDLLVTLKNDTAAGFAALQAQIKKSEADSLALSGAVDRLSLSVDKLSGSMVKTVVGADAMASGQAKVATSMDGATAATLRQERALLRYGGELAGVRQGFAAAGVGLGGWTAILGGAAVYAAAKFETEMQRVQGNTGATTAQMKLMESQVLSLGAKGPASLDDIAVGFRHVSDEGYRGKDAITVVDAAWKAAIATNGKVADVANALSTVLGNQHAPAAAAARDMDIIVTAAQQGNMTVQDFATNYSKVGVVMSSIHQPLVDGAAMFATLSRATANPAWAATYEQNMLIHIIKPTGQATKEMEALKLATGVDLASAFHQFAQGQISVKQVMDDVRLAVHGDTTAMETLFGGVRGGQGSLVLMNNHWQDYLKISGTVKTSNKNVENSFNEMMHTTGASLGTTKNDVIELGISLGKDLLPSVKDLSSGLGGAATGLKSFNDETHGGIGETVKLGIELYAVTKAVNVLRLGYIALRDAEIAAWLATNPVTLIAAGLLVGYEIVQKMSEHQKGAALSMQELIHEYADGGITLKEFDKAAVAHGVTLDANLTRTINAAKADYDHAQAIEKKHKALAAFDKELNFGQSIQDQLSTFPGAGNGGKPTVAQFDVAGTVAKALTDITKYADAIINDTNTFGAHSKQVEEDYRQLDKAKATYVLYNDQLTALTSTTSILANNNRALAAPLLAQARNLEAFGKAIQSSIATIKSYDTAGVAAAKDLRSFAGMQTQGDMAAITKSVPSGNIPYLAGTPAPLSYALAGNYGGTAQYSPSVLPHGTAASAEALSPDDRAAMAKLSDSIDQLPPQFQGAFDSVVSGLQQKEKDNYNAYIDKLNKESTRDAEAKTKIEQAHDAAVAKANENAQSDLQKENTRYLTQLDNQEAKHNQDLSTHLASFQVAFQTTLSTFEANMVADTQKAESERQTHNDNLTKDYGQLQERLAGVHGKNADEQRQHAYDLYNQQIQTEDQNYGRQVTAMENHVKGQTSAFTGHIKGLKDILDNANRNSDTTLSRQKTTDASKDKTVKAGIASNLFDAVYGPGGADAVRAAALSSEYSRHSARDDTLLSNYHASDKVAQQAAKAATPEEMIATLTGKKTSAYDSAYAKVTLDILDHGSATQADTVALRNAAAGKQQIQDAQNKATALATKAVYDFATAVQTTATNISLDKSKLAGYEIHPDQGNLLVPLTPSQRAANARSQGDSGINVASSQTQAEAAWNDLLKNAKDKAAQDAANLDVDKRLAIATGDWATAAADAKTQFLTLGGSLTDYVQLQQKANTEQDRQNQLLIIADQALGDFIGAASLSKDAFLRGIEGLDQYVHDQQLADEQQRQQNDRQIEYDQRVGNTAEALSLITDEYHKGQRTLAELDQAYNDNQISVQKATEANNAFYASTGQFGQLLSSITSQIAQGVTDSQAKVTLDAYTGNTAAIAADTQSAIAHREAQEKLTAATWDATYAAANAATQSQMRQSLASPMVSQQSTVQGLASGVFNAQLGVIAAQSAVEVSLMQAEVTATNDLASIITASSAVAKAQGDKQLARLNDSIPMMNDNHAIAQDIKDGNAQQLAMDKEQLLIDRTTAAMDQAVATFQIQIAEDGLKMAQDKMMVDQMNASAAYQVAVDGLVLAQDNVTLAEATQKLGLDQLTVQTDISTSLGSVVDYLSMIDGDLQNLQSAQDQIQTDQTNLAYDTSNQNITAQYGSGILAGDTVQSASDSAAMQQAQQAYEIQIAQYKVQLNSYQLQQKDSTTNGQSVAALQAMVKVLQGMVVNMNSPAGKAVRAAGIGGNTLASLQNSFATTQTPMGFS